MTANAFGLNWYETILSIRYSLFSFFIALMVFTGLFIFVILTSTSKYATKGFAGISISFTYVFVHIVGILIICTSVNPSRSLDSAIFVCGEALLQQWLFWFTPILSGIFAAWF